MSDESVQPQTDKKIEKSGELPDEALDKATGGMKMPLVQEEALVKEPYLRKNSVSAQAGAAGLVLLNLASHTKPAGLRRVVGQLLSSRGSGVTDRSRRSFVQQVLGPAHHEIVVRTWR